MSDNKKVEPDFDKDSGVITIPDLEGVDYRIGGRVVTGDVTIKRKTVVSRSAKPGFKLAKGAVTDFKFEPTPEKPKVEDDTSDAKKVDTPAEPVVATTAGSDPQSPAQDSGRGFSGSNSRLP